MSGRRRVTGFADDRAWAWRELVDPDGPPTWRQLVALHRAGALRLADPGGARFSKGEASAAIGDAIAAGHLRPRPPADPAARFDRVCREIVEHVDAEPGCTTTSVVRAVRAGRAYVGGRVRDLLELGVLEDRACRRGPGRARELWRSDDAGDEAAS